MRIYFFVIYQKIFSVDICAWVTNMDVDKNNYETNDLGLGYKHGCGQEQLRNKWFGVTNMDVDKNNYITNDLGLQTWMWTRTTTKQMIWGYKHGCGQEQLRNKWFGVTNMNVDKNNYENKHLVLAIYAFHQIWDVKSANQHQFSKNYYCDINRIRLIYTA